MVIVDNRAAIGISELTGMIAISTGIANVPFLSPGDDNGMRLAHRRTCHTSVSILC